MNRFLLLGAIGVFGILLPVSQLVLAPGSYDVVWVVVMLFVVASFAILFVVARLQSVTDRRALRVLREKHPEAKAELATVWCKGTPAFRANVVVDREGVDITSSGGFSRHVGWAEIRGLKSVQYGQTYRDALEVATDGEAICFMPVSTMTLLPLSLRRSDQFFEAVKKAWRVHGTIHPPLQSS